jgi:hypothetical protein
MPMTSAERDQTDENIFRITQACRAEQPTASVSRTSDGRISKRLMRLSEDSAKSSRTARDREIVERLRWWALVFRLL